MITNLRKTIYSRMTKTSREKSKEQEEPDKSNDIIVKLKQAVFNKEKNINSPNNKFS